MRSHSAVWTSLLLSCLLGRLVAQEPPRAEPETTFASPQAVFEVAKKASQKKDFAAFARCLTPDSRDQLAGQLVVAGGMMRQFAGKEKTGKLKQNLPELERLFDRHGLTRDVLEKMEKANKEKKPAGDNKEQAKRIQALAGPIKNKPAFIGDFLRWLEKGEAGKPRPGPLDNAQLKNLKVTGDKARGVVVKDIGGKENSEPMDFVKIGKSWHIVLPVPKEGPAKAPPPPPAPDEKK